MITKQVRIYALLTAYSWPKRRPEYTGFRSKYLLRTVRKVNLKSKLLKDYKLLDKHSNTFMCVFHNEKNNEIVYTIRGTDLTRFEEKILARPSFANFQPVQVEENFAVE